MIWGRAKRVLEGEMMEEPPCYNAVSLAITTYRMQRAVCCAADIYISFSENLSPTVFQKSELRKRPDVFQAREVTR